MNQYGFPFTCDQTHRLSRSRSTPQSLIREIVSTSKGFNPHNFFKTMNNDNFDQEISIDDLSHINGAWHAQAIRFIARNAPTAVAFYAGLAGGLAAGEDFEKAAHEAGKNAGIVD